jgi:predicted phosphohydrolase
VYLRVVVTSDTHYQPHFAAILEQFVDELVELKPDCLVVAGDVGEGVEHFENMLTLLEKLPCPRLILTGNHDLWKNNGKNSQELFETVLPKITRDHGAIWLEGENWIKDGLGICGTNGWYDYSARDPSLSFGIEDYVKLKANYIVDGSLVLWKWSDIEFSNMIGDAFEQRLAQLETDSSVRKVLVVTHVPPFEEGIVRKPNKLHWNFSNAYFGNFTLGQRIQKYSRVTRVISGHTHVGKNAQIGSIDMHVLESDYGRPAYALIDYETKPP